MWSGQELRELLKRLDGSSADDLETETLEFKRWEPELRAVHRMASEAAVCLANARGGAVVFGVRDRFRSRKEALQGIGEYDERAFRRAIYDGTEPHILVDLEELVEPEGRLLVMRVNRGMPPHTTSDGLG